MYSSCRDAQRLDGLFIEQWASYARRNTRTATAVYKENGQLNCRRTSLVAECRGGKEQQGSRADPFVCICPWAGSVPRKSTSLGTFDAVHTSLAWSQFIRSNAVHNDDIEKEHVEVTDLDSVAMNAG